MTTYRIPYTDDTREEVLAIVKDFSHDILIDTVDEYGVGITIETDEAPKIHNDLLEEIGKKVYATK